MLVFAALLALAQSVSGQISSSFVAATTTSTINRPSGTSLSVRPAATYKISVGIDHKFSPDITQALVGDLIEFDFMPLNHSVVRAEYVSALSEQSRKFGNGSHESQIQIPMYSI